ncbi:senescence-associated family protein, partial [Trifolium medium]|nr:senescence-associated family protein [Trifolium medium]
TEKIDRGVKEKAKRLNRIATILKDIAQSRLKSAADEHWSDGALERLCKIGFSTCTPVILSSHGRERGVSRVQHCM